MPDDARNILIDADVFLLERTKVTGETKLPAGPVTVEVTTGYDVAKPAGPLDATITVNGDHYATGVVPASAPLLFTSNGCLDIGTCLGGPVSLDYYDWAPFPFEGEIDTVHVRCAT